MTREQGLQLKIGDRVVHKPSGSTGEVRLIIPEWGVEVWNYNRNRERWWWDSMTVRNPRTIKRYPRPFRFARLNPTKCCHCPEGVMLPVIRKNKKTILKKATNRRMKVICEKTVRCEWCRLLIGSESFPARIKRASEMLRRAEESGTLLPCPRNKKASGKAKGKAGQRKAGPKKRSPDSRVQGGKKKKSPPKSKRNLVLRPRRRKEASDGTAPAEATVPTGENPPIPPVESPAVSAPEEATKSLVVEDATMDQIVEAEQQKPTEAPPETPPEEEKKG